MSVNIISYTQNPMDVIAIAAGTSYGKDDPKHSRVVNCFKSGHMSVFEHASVTFRVSGISRACSHQLVRHRIASFDQKSQRYTKVDTESEWYVMPPSIDFDHNGDGTEVTRLFDKCAELYNELLEFGFKPEDARYVLPEATKTELTCTMNVRELFHFLDLRTDKAAQWEIRDMANELWNEVAAIDEQWGKLIGLWSTGLAA